MFYRRAFKLLSILFILRTGKNIFYEVLATVTIRVNLTVILYIVSDPIPVLPHVYYLHIAAVGAKNLGVTHLAYYC